MCSWVDPADPAQNSVYNKIWMGILNLKSFFLSLLDRWSCYTILSLTLITAYTTFNLVHFNNSLHIHHNYFDTHPLIPTVGIASSMAEGLCRVSFNQLPIEILLEIAINVPDLASLYGLCQASGTFAIIFDEYGSTILESVTNNGMTGQRRPPYYLSELVRLVILLRTMSLDTSSLKSSMSIETFLNQHLGASDSSAACKPIPRGTPRTVLRSILLTAAKIDHLTSGCLATSMRHCLRLRPLHPKNRAQPRAHQFCGANPEYLAWEGEAYTPHSSGPPSWLEMARATRAFWTVHLYLDLMRNFYSGNFAMCSKHGHWQMPLALEDLELWGSRHVTITASSRSLATVLTYLREELNWTIPKSRPEHWIHPSQEAESEVLDLPWPPNHNFDWTMEGVDSFPGGDETCTFTQKKLGPLSLYESPADIFLHRMSRMARFSPAFDIPFDTTFQRLGMAFWDSRRLMGLELLGPLKEDGFDDEGMFKYFHIWELAYTWKSIAVQGSRHEEVRVSSCTLSH